MPKQKTHRGAAKRLSLTKNGLVKRAKAFKRHILNKKKTRNSANCTGEDHCADNNLLNVDSNVASGILALADNGDLITLLTVSKIYVHDYAKQKHDNYVKQIKITADSRKPTCL